MLDNKGFDLWADGYDKSVGLSEEGNTYPFAGYKNVLNTIFNEIMSAENPTVLDIGFGAGGLTFENIVKQPEKREVWDAYFADGTLAGKDLVRGEDVPEGLYHMVCEILVRHKDGSFLVMQRDWNKTMFAGFYEATAGGSALKGETALECAMRELHEETGIKVKAEDLIFLGEVLGGNSIYKEYMCITECDKYSVTLQEGETISYQWMEPKEFFELVETEQYVPIQRERRIDLYKKIKEEEKL